MSDNPNIIICLACEHIKVHHYGDKCIPICRVIKVKEKGEVGYEIGLGPEIICMSKVGKCDCKGFK